MINQKETNMSIGIYYGTTTGKTEKVAEMIAYELGAEVAEVKDISNAISDELERFDVLIFGTSTWNVGEMQMDWETFVEEELESVDFSHKRVAFFGLGDQEGYPDYFADGMGKLYHKVKERGAKIVGSWNTENYDFDESEAVDNGSFCGLVIDEDNQEDLTERRIMEWCTILRKELNLV